MTGEAAFERVNAAGSSPILLLCDHATNRVPPGLGGGLGLPPAEMERHIAHDIGARGVTLELARRLDATALLTRFSRLVIDPNRGEDDPTLVMKLYDGTLVPGNRDVGPAARAERLEAWHRPYHRAIGSELDRRIAAGRDPVLISIHSFTPQLRGRPPRPWHLGILWDRDARIARPLMDRLRAEPGLCIGDNQPYRGELEGDTLNRHGTRRGLRHALIELRQDLIATEAAQAAWAERLAAILAEIVPA